MQIAVLVSFPINWFIEANQQLHTKKAALSRWDVAEEWYIKHRVSTERHLVVSLLVVQNSTDCQLPQ